MRCGAAGPLHMRCVLYSLATLRPSLRAHATAAVSTCTTGACRPRLRRRAAAPCFAPAGTLQTLRRPSVRASACVVRAPRFALLTRCARGLPAFLFFDSDDDPLVQARCAALAFVFTRAADVLFVRSMRKRGLRKPRCARRCRTIVLLSPPRGARAYGCVASRSTYTRCSVGADAPPRRRSSRPRRTGARV